MSAGDYFALPESNLPTELLNGELNQMPSPSVAHQRVLLCLAGVLRTIIPNGEVFIAPLDVYFDELHIVQPDLVWVAEGSRCAILESHLRGAPDLIFEILSLGSLRRDRKVKFQLYQKHGVREYWIFDAQEPLIEVWQWVEGKFQLVDMYSLGEGIESPLLGRIEVKAIVGE